MPDYTAKFGLELTNLLGSTEQAKQAMKGLASAWQQMLSQFESSSRGLESLVKTRMDMLGTSIDRLKERVVVGLPKNMMTDIEGIARVLAKTRNELIIAGASAKDQAIKMAEATANALDDIKNRVKTVAGQSSEAFLDALAVLMRAVGPEMSDQLLAGMVEIVAKSRTILPALVQRLGVELTDIFGQPIADVGKYFRQMDESARQMKAADLLVDFRRQMVSVQMGVEKVCNAFLEYEKLVMRVSKARGISTEQSREILLQGKALENLRFHFESLAQTNVSQFAADVMKALGMIPSRLHPLLFKPIEEALTKFPSAAEKLVEAVVAQRKKALPGLADLAQMLAQMREGVSEGGKVEIVHRFVTEAAKATEPRLGVLRALEESINRIRSVPGMSPRTSAKRPRGMLGGIFGKLLGAVQSLLAPLAITNLLATYLGDIIDILIDTLAPLFIPIQDVLLVAINILQPVIQSLLPTIRFVADIIISAINKLGRVGEKSSGQLAGILIGGILGGLAALGVVIFVGLGGILAAIVILLGLIAGAVYGQIIADWLLGSGKGSEEYAGVENIAGHSPVMVIKLPPSLAPREIGISEKDLARHLFPIPYLRQPEVPERLTEHDILSHVARPEVPERLTEHVILPHVARPEVPAATSLVPKDTSKSLEGKLEPFMDSIISAVNGVRSAVLDTAPTKLDDIVEIGQDIRLAAMLSAERAT